MVGQDIEFGERAFQVDEPHEERQINRFFLFFPFILEGNQAKQFAQGIQFGFMEFNINFIGKFECKNKEFDSMLFIQRGSAEKF